MKSLSNELEELNNEYDNLTNKIEAIDNKLSLRKSILSFSGFFVLILFLFSLAMIGGIILTLVSGNFNLYSDLFSVILLILGIGWIVFIVISRINAKTISTNSIIRNDLSKKLEDTNSKINKLKLLIDKEKLKLKEKHPTEIIPEPQIQNLELNKNNSLRVDHKLVDPLIDKKKETKKEVFEKKKEDELLFEEEQKKKGLVKFVPISLQIKELMAEEGHDKMFDNKVSKKWKMSKDVPLEITWGTPEQVFEWTQKEKGYIKFINEAGKIRWGTEKQIAEWKKKRPN